MAFLTAKQERLRVDVGELKEMGTLESFGTIRVSKSLHGELSSDSYITQFRLRQENVLGYLFCNVASSCWRCSSLF